MPREELQKRRPEPSQVFGSKFAAALHTFSATFLKSDSFQHALTKGEEREGPIREFFAEHLPACYEVVGGEVVDSRDNHSTQLDVMIYDGNRNFAFYSEDACILPAEALLVSIEVKSRLTKTEIAGILNAAQQLYRLLPFGQPPEVVKTEGGAYTPSFRYFHTVFAYETDLVAAGWPQNELNRIVAAAREGGVDPNLLSRVYVANRGFVNVPSNIGSIESPGEGNAFMHFYMDVLNFVMRENGRRNAAEYTRYAGRLTRDLQQLTRPAAG